jgi:glutaminyl-tRNA synthetase
MMSEARSNKNFITQIIEDDLSAGLPVSSLRFRFPPEPNGFLHIGHTKALGISFGLGEAYGAPVNLRFDDTNPAKEEQKYVDAIKTDIQWLGYQWDKECYTSDYFDQLYQWAILLIKLGNAYVDSQSSEDIAAQKGTPTEPGTNSPFRLRTVEENLRLFNEMKLGQHDSGSHVLRAKIDMASPNMLLRDPILYRILKQSHHRTGQDWCIYPMYDWAHGQSDYIERISHSLCSLEFKPHRDLYEWCLDQIGQAGTLLPKQREFARLNLSYTVMSKRKLLRLVEQNIVAGWDDPRMPTISGLRRRGYTPMSLRNFVETVGVAKRENVIDVALLEFCVREDLNTIAPRAMAVLDPIKLVITNYDAGRIEMLSGEINPEDPSAGDREIPFSNTLLIEREDFKEVAERKFFRLSLGQEVRLKSAYIVKAESVQKDANGRVTEVYCTYDPDSLSGSGSEASLRKVKGTLHWVSEPHAIKAEVRIYDRLFKHESPDTDKDVDFMSHLNPDSLHRVEAYLEPGLATAKPGDHFQFQRLGYFVADPDSTPNQLVFNKTVGLRDNWAKKPQDPILQHSNAAKGSERSAIEDIKRLGKKYTNLPEEKRLKVRQEILTLAATVSYEDLEPLFKTAQKKTGTRIAAVLTAAVWINNGGQITNALKVFLKDASQADNALLASEAKLLQIND